MNVPDSHQTCETFERLCSPSSTTADTRRLPTPAQKPCAFKQHHRKILVLIIEAIEHRELLLSMCRIGGGIKVDDDVRGLLLSSAYKQVDQEIIDRVNAFDLSASHFKDDIAFFHGLLRFAASECVQKPIDGRAAGE